MTEVSASTHVFSGINVWGKGLSADAGMFSPASVVCLGLICAAAVAEGSRVRCEDLEVRFKTLVERGSERKTECWMRFNLFTEYCVRHYDAEMTTCAGKPLNDHWDWALERKIWTQQVSILESVVKHANLSDEPLRLYFLFNVGHENQSVFFEVQQELFAVGENGTLDYCRGPSHERLEERLQRCRECPQVFARRINATEVSHKWLRLCQSKSDRAHLAQPPKELGFVCQPKPVKTTTTTTTTIATTVPPIESTAVAGAPSENVPTVETGDETVEKRSEANPVVAPVISVVAVLTIVMVGLYLMRVRLGRVWRKLRGPASIY